MRVVDRRRGLPVALAILYIAAARYQGWPICGLNFPGHFLLSLELGGARGIVDPFDGAQALEVIERMLILAPGAARLWHEAGALHAKLGNLRAATRSFVKLS
jgi:regulator of sirC expression with transglutaminase-like and TPR domain